MKVINGKYITKDHYKSLVDLKSRGLELTYGSNHSNPIGYTTNTHCNIKASTKTIIEKAKDIPKWFYDDLILFGELFKNDKISVFLDNGVIKTYAKTAKYKSISINLDNYDTDK